MLRIGITEGSDPVFHPEWKTNAAPMDGIILITKNITDTRLQQDVASFWKKTHRLILHVTCTGLGGTVLEPNVPKPEQIANSLPAFLLSSGIPSDHIVWRMDPLIPSDDPKTLYQQIYTSLMALSAVNAQLPEPITRIRISVADNYRHVRERFIKSSLQPLYHERWNPTVAQIMQIKAELKDLLSGLAFPYTLELCAETSLYHILNAEPALPCELRGCVSDLDLRTMNFPESEIRDAIASGQNGQNRNGCCCLRIKQELIPVKARCPHNCLYCYWRG